ncbi:MAG: phage tail protein, partial [Firmicutes bacterium]|nr:phage tail protein [Bacillota bacterium]
MPLIIPEYITIKTAAGATAAYLSPEADGLKDAIMERELNGKSTLTFSLPILPGGADVPALTVKGVMPTVDVPNPNDKWQYITDQYRIYAPDITGQMREFVVQNPDAIEKERDGKKLWGKVTAHESWVKLGKDYVDPGISNDPQTPDPPPLAVIIISGGSDLSGGRYPVGSAAHALYAILQGTGWSVGTVDVEGTHDLETEKISVLENINKIQEIWGGYLVWDSINKTVSLRSEAAWAPYTGYQVRYAKNLKGITRTSDFDIITKLYPFGENDLNIGSVNSGQIYLENHSYTDEVLEGIWVNQDIADPTELKTEAEKYLAKVCKPRHNYRVKQVDLRLLSGYQHEDFDLGHLVDVIDEELGANDKT